MKKSAILENLKEVIGRDKKRFGKLVKYDGQNGFSEEEFKGLEELYARSPPPDAITEPAHALSYVYRDRLSPKNAEGGGFVKGDDGANRPHYWGLSTKRLGMHQAPFHGDVHEQSQAIPTFHVGYRACATTDLPHRRISRRWQF